MKKILLGLLAVGATAGLAVGVTRAYFSDTETSEDNTFIAGTLDLKVDDHDDPDVVHVLFDNIAPKWSERQSWILKNNGSIAGTPTLTFSDITNKENGQNEPEANVDPTAGEFEGELGSILRMNIYWRQDSGAWNYIGSSLNSGDPILNSIGGKTVGDGSWDGGRADNPLPELNPGDEVEVQIRPFWHDDPGIDDNKAQSDSTEFDITFELVQ